MTLRAVVYREDGTAEYDDLAAAKAADGTTWVRASTATDAEVDAVADAFDIHRLAIEDVVKGVRPKTEEFSKYTFVLVKSAELTRGETRFDEEIIEESVGVFVGSDWIVSMATGDDAPVDRVWSAVVRGDERLLQQGPDFTAYRIVDVVVDEYFSLLDHISDQIEAIEEEVLVSTDIETLQAINDVRRDLLSFRKLAWPMRESLSVLARGDPAHVRQSTEKYFRDVYDHLVHVVDFIETYRDLVAGTRDIYLNTLQQSSNEVMKVLTVIATVFLPLTFVAGVYGMNFGGSPYNMPELTWRFGYPAVMAGMALLGIVMVWAFRREGYI
ncbi:magnesium/cobalt transporter CorA [Natronomonas salina]|uniref:magnesium/cobalt transporter CorA n=1 Tax=Natronomonas salina TaxID=1710540 RepID=UPI0015B6B085|nr:magnesium/cobalt transporter CorA [Natronomonas salina]QLD89918.1 magnesium/cobalt transporter CorA [Natronomonas salina]